MNVAEIRSGFNSAVRSGRSRRGTRGQHQGRYPPLGQVIEEVDIREDQDDVGIRLGRAILIVGIAAGSVRCATSDQNRTG